MRTNKEIVRIQTENLVGMLLTIYIYILSPATFGKTRRWTRGYASKMGVSEHGFQTFQPSDFHGFSAQHF